MGITSIQIDRATRERLARLKSSSRETYDELLNKLLALVPEGDEEGKYQDAFRLGLLQAKIEVREGRTISHADLKRQLGL